MKVYLKKYKNGKQVEKLEIETVAKAMKLGKRWLNNLKPYVKYSNRVKNGFFYKISPINVNVNKTNSEHKYYH